MKINCIRTKLQKKNAIIVESNLSNEYDRSEETINTGVSEENFGDLVTIKSASPKLNRERRQSTSAASGLSTLHGVDSICEESEFFETSEGFLDLGEYDSDATMRQGTSTPRKNGDNFDQVNRLDKGRSSDFNVSPLSDQGTILNMAII